MSKRKPLTEQELDMLEDIDRTNRIMVRIEGYLDLHWVCTSKSMLWCSGYDLSLIAKSLAKRGYLKFDSWSRNVEVTELGLTFIKRDRIAHLRRQDDTLIGCSEEAPCADCTRVHGKAVGQ